MSIVSEIQRLSAAKASLKTAIEAKGVTVGDVRLDGFAEKIAAISTGTFSSPSFFNILPTADSILKSVDWDALGYQRNRALLLILCGSRFVTTPHLYQKTRWCVNGEIVNVGSIGNGVTLDSGVNWVVMPTRATNTKVYNRAEVYGINYTEDDADGDFVPLSITNGLDPIVYYMPNLKISTGGTYGGHLYNTLICCKEIIASNYMISWGSNCMFDIGDGMFEIDDSWQNTANFTSKRFVGFYPQKFKSSASVIFAQLNDNYNVDRDAFAKFDENGNIIGGFVFGIEPCPVDNKTVSFSRKLHNLFTEEEATKITETLTQKNWGLVW